MSAESASAGLVQVLILATLMSSFGSYIFGWLSEMVAAPTLGRHVRRTLHQLKRQVEHEQLRAEAERRRAAREASPAGAG